MDASYSVVAAQLRALLDKRGWTHSHLAVLLAERSGKTKKGALRQVQQWLGGGQPNARNREDLAAVFGVPASGFLPAAATQAEYDDLIVRRNRLERELERERETILQLQKEMAKMATLQRQPPEQPKHGSRTRRDSRQSS